MLWTKGFHQPKLPTYINEKWNMKSINGKICLLFFKHVFQKTVLTDRCSKIKF